jgi:hypothetical protein
MIHPFFLQFSLDAMLDRVYSFKSVSLNLGILGRIYKAIGSTTIPHNGCLKHLLLTTSLKTSEDKAIYALPFPQEINPTCNIAGILTKTKNRLTI